MRNVSAFQPGPATKAYYTLNGNSFDKSGQTNTGTDTSITYPQGRFGQGAKFNGSSSYIIKSPTITGLPNTVFTLSLWFQRTSFANSVIACFGLDGANTGAAIVSNSTGTINTEFQIGSGTGKVTSGVLGLNKWHNAVFTCDGTNVFLYVNGFLSGTVSRGSGSANSAGAIVIGAWVNSGGAVNGNYYNGSIDEVIIESRAWTAKEVETYYRKSMLNYRQNSWANVVYTYIAELGKGTFALTGKNLSTFRDYVSQLLKGTFTLTGKNLITNRGYIAQLLKGTFTLVGKALRVPTTWINTTKNSSTWTNSTKNSSSWTNTPKS